MNIEDLFEESRSNLKIDIPLIDEDGQESYMEFIGGIPVLIEFDNGLFFVELNNNRYELSDSFKVYDKDEAELYTKRHKISKITLNFQAAELADIDYEKLIELYKNNDSVIGIYVFDINGTELPVKHEGNGILIRSSDFDNFAVASIEIVVDESYFLGG